MGQFHPERRHAGIGDIRVLLQIVLCVKQPAAFDNSDVKEIPKFAQKLKPAGRQFRTRRTSLFFPAVCQIMQQGIFSEGGYILIYRKIVKGGKTRRRILAFTPPPAQVMFRREQAGIGDFRIAFPIPDRIEQAGRFEFRTTSGRAFPGGRRSEQIQDAPEESAGPPVTGADYRIICGQEAADPDRLLLPDSFLLGMLPAQIRGFGKRCGIFSFQQTPGLFLPFLFSLQRTQLLFEKLICLLPIFDLPFLF
ncbi:MAG: hypothetical protein HPZ91_12430, partial [Lentisphaeria bacterium]|nr:hypothetical protein [Lentisphaeria bacterium]